MFPDLTTDDAFRLETKRLWLRWPRIADAVSVVKYAGDQAVSHYSARIPYPYPQSDAEQTILNCRKKNATGMHSALALTRKGKPNDLIGMMSIHPSAAGEAQIGYWIGQPFWGQGLVAEALDEMLALTFATTRVRNVTALVRPENKASRNLLASRQFVEGDERLVNMPMRGGIFPNVEYSLDQNAWREHEAKRFRKSVRTAGAMSAMMDDDMPGGVKLSA